MSAEWFFKLKEYDSLGKMKSTHYKAIIEQEERLSKLNEKRQDNNLEVTELKSELLSVQQNYHESEKKMNQCEAQASRLRDIGGDSEKIALFKTDAETLEDSLFKMMERLDEIQVILEDKKTFLSGLEKTFSEIESEVSTELQFHHHEISQAVMRMKLIEEELPVEFRLTLERTLKKNLAIGSFTRIENGSCFFCRYKISRLEESEIDMLKNLKLCPQCTRIFLPYGS